MAGVPAVRQVIGKAHPSSQVQVRASIGQLVHERVGEGEGQTWNLEGQHEPRGRVRGELEEVRGRQLGLERLRALRQSKGRRSMAPPLLCRRPPHHNFNGWWRCAAAVGPGSLGESKHGSPCHISGRVLLQCTR